MSSNTKREYQDDDDEEHDSDLMSDFSDEEKRHKDLKSQFKGQRQQKIPQQISQLISDANSKYVFQNQIDEAIEIAKEIIRQYPSFTDSYDLLGNIFEEQGMMKEAAEYQFLAAYQSNANAKKWESIAQLYKKAKCYDSAGYCFGRVLKSDTLNTSLWCERAKCYEQTGELKKAIKCFERVIKMDEKNFDAIKNCAKLYLKLDKSDESIKLLKTMIKPNDVNKNYNIIHMICEIFNKKLQYKELCEFLEEYCEMKDKNVRETILDELPLAILIFYAVSHAKLQNKEECELGFNLILRREMEENDDFVSIMEELAEMYESSKEEEKALQIYKRLISLPFLQMNYQQVWEKYGILLLKLHESEDSIKEIEELIQKFPDSIDLRTELSTVYQRLGRNQESLKILENLLRDDIEENDYEARKQSDEINLDIKEEELDRYSYSASYQDENNDEDEYIYQNDDDEEEDDGKQQNRIKVDKRNIFDRFYLDRSDQKKIKKEIDIEDDDNEDQDADNDDSDFNYEEKQNKSMSKKKKASQLSGQYDQMREQNEIKPKKKIKLNTKAERRIKNQMDDEKDDEVFQINKYQQKDFFEQTQAKKNELAQNYSVKNMYLEYKKGQIILDTTKEISKHKLDKQFQTLKQSLQLEKEYNNLKKSVLNRILIESQKKGFQRRLTTPNNLKTFDNPNQTLLIKKKRQMEEQEILMKKKFKKSEELTAKYLQNVEVLSLKVGDLEYIQYLIKMLKVLVKYDCYVKISKVCSLAHKLHVWKDVKFYGYQETVAKYGLLASLKLQNYDKAFTYIKLLINRNSDRLYLQVILCIIMRHISNVNIYKTFLSRMVKKSDDSPKFLPIVACGFLETGNFDLATDVLHVILKNDKANSLCNLSLSVCYAQLTTARTTYVKEQMAAKAVHYMQAYQQTRGLTRQMEIYYNLGRFFIHLSMNQKAIENFENCIQLFTSKNLKGSYILNPKSKETDEKILQKAIYNLILLHKNLGNYQIAQSLVKQYNTLS
ncbi:hypothetical protein ABPG74_021192 [Tetrahymena malaccensis]